MKRKYSQNNFQVNKSDYYLNGSISGLSESTNSRNNNDSIQNVKIEKGNKGSSFNTSAFFSHSNRQHRNDAEIYSRNTSSFIKKNMGSNFSQRKNFDFQRTGEDFVNRESKFRNINTIESCSKGSTSNVKTNVENNKNDQKKNVANKNSLPVETWVSEGIMSQITSSQMGKQELVSLTKSIINLLNLKLESKENSLLLEKTRCMLNLDLLELRARKMSKVIEIYLSERSYYLDSIKKLDKIMKHELIDIKNLMENRVAEEDNILSFWSKCEHLSEKINLMKKKKDIEKQIEDEKLNCKHIELEIVEKKENFEEKLRNIDRIHNMFVSLY